MALSRRQFLKLAGGSGAGAAILAACRPATARLLVQSPAQIPEDLVLGVDNWYATRCAQCDSGCGLIVRVIEGRAKKVEGNPAHPVNAGKLCVRAHGAVQATYHPDRIRRPMKAIGDRSAGRFQEITWEEALDQLTSRLKQLKGANRGNAIVMATEPLSDSLRLIVSRFAAGLGQAAHAQFEPVDLVTLNTAVKRVFNADSVPHFDIANAKYVLSFGADFLMGWVSQVRHSLDYGEFRQGAGRQRGYLVHVDSRFSGTAANADEWVPVKPGAEGKLALAMAHVIVRDRLGDAQAASQLFGENPMAALQPYNPPQVSAATGVPADQIERIARSFAANQPGIAIGGGSAGAQTNGVFNLTAIYALNHLVGNVGKPGGVVLNPPAPLAGDLALKTAVPSGQYATTSFKDWQDLAGRMQRGEVQMLLVRNADLVHGLPAGLGVEDAIRDPAKLPFIVSFSSFLDDTTYYADLVLPSSLPMEDWGASVPNPAPGFQAMTFQQPVIRPFNDTRGFGDILLALAPDLGMEKDLPWQTHRDLLREEAQKLQQLKRGSIQGATFEAYWNDLLSKGAWADPGSKSASRIAVPKIDLTKPDPDAGASEADYPFALVPFPSVSLADGRNANLPWMQGTPDPITTGAWETWVEVNSLAAKEQGWKEGDMVSIESPNGRIEAAVYPNPALPRGVVAVPMGQGYKNYGRFANGRGANVFTVLAPALERETGSLAWAATRVKVAPTGRRIRIPKFEGSVIPVDYDHNVKITNGRA